VEPHRSTLNLRQARLSDEPQVRRFLEIFYTARFRTKYPNRWQWQFVNNPFVPRHTLPVWLALDGENVVGQLSLQYSPIWIKGRTQLGAWGVDFGVLPSYRGQGLGFRLQALVAQSVPWLLSAVMDRSAVRIKERLGFIKGPKVQHFRRFCHLSGADILRYLFFKTRSRARAWRVGIRVFGQQLGGVSALAAMLRTANSRYAALKARPHAANSLQIEEFDTFGSEFDKLWEESRAAYGMTTARTAEYLNWRYVECPDLQYRKFRASDGSGVTGFLVLRERNLPELKSVRIVDLFCRPPALSTMENLLQRVVANYVNTYPFIEAACSHPSGVAALRKLGFLPMEEHTPLAGGTLSGEDDVAIAITGWTVTMGDQDWDQFRPVDDEESGFTHPSRPSRLSQHS